MNTRPDTLDPYCKVRNDFADHWAVARGNTLMNYDGINTDSTNL